MQLFLNLFSGLATIITGVVAIIIYFRQKRDTKTQAARVLLMEIRTAEERIFQIKEIVQNSLTIDLPSIFPTKSWKTYSHLFISDFDQDELKLISSFYDYGELIEDFARRNNDFFWVTTEERARITAQKIAEIIREASRLTGMDDSVKDNYISINRVFLSSKLDSHNIPYKPQKTINEISSHLNKVQMITTSSCGIKLKKLAKLN